MIEDYRSVWLVDFEFHQPAGGRPDPVCLVALDIKSGRRLKLWRDDFGRAPPYDIDAGSIFCAYYASAELGCHLALGWHLPVRVLDLYAEFRCLTNGLPTPDGAGLVGALSYFGLDSIGAIEKQRLRELIVGGGPWSAEEQAGILDYCESDVDALARLLPAMIDRISLPHAFLRGRYMSAAARMEFCGVPIDVPTLDLLRAHWDDIKDQLIAAVDSDYHVFDQGSFRQDRFANWLIQAGIPWPVTETGQLSLSDATFRQMAKAFPAISPLRELRNALSDLRLNDLAVGADGRNRCLLSAFRAKTGRNQPSNTKFIFGPSVWLRGLIKPLPGHAIAYVDWSQQEFGIAAALSGDPKMQSAYNSGDPYMAFAKQAGHVPKDATKASHGAKRELFKQCVLAVQFGMSAEGLAARIGQSVVEANILLRAHQETFWRYWQWSEAAVDLAMSTGSLQTTFGWRIRVGENANPRSLRNFPCQANGNEMLRLACCLATERGIEVCAPIHDAVLIAAPLERIAEDVKVMQAAMAEASRVVLAGFDLATDATVIRYPHRYMDARGMVMWERVMRLIGAGSPQHEVDAA
jgi:hypothetical protein